MLRIIGFQSTPAITGERAAREHGLVPVGWRFNPRPPLLASEPGAFFGRPFKLSVSIHARHYWRASRGAPAWCGWALRVSIHARHYWRASQPVSPRPTWARCCFNPRPPLLASEPGYNAFLQALAAVSIHARHYWRASPAGRTGRMASWRVSIHARHYWRASRAGIAAQFALRRFQSTPAITGERAPTGCGLTRSTPCFNPRPPLLASEPGYNAFLQALAAVSIHARHYWRASLS